MRPLALLLPATLLLTASSAPAQTTPYPPADTAAISTVEVTAPAKIIRIRPEQAEKIGGTYDMSNGWHLKVRTTSRYIDATIDNQRPIRLVATTPYHFSSGDGNVRMEFNRGEYGDDMLMSYVPAPGLAAIVVSAAPIAQR
ncbi:hypothetical protein [Massilia sp. Mn16-1_5]|uniref:hypothetical protein n=1 Tax=Massilia sp. Mn16-1_5 TaxID=2079199 RepID=UPI00109ED863|nr:hypothetical protein [Massilia sp. Mn16-1_5]THC41847.1 hypothetical protein C2862_17065 [Massilia sp. Mn16-1_5]